MTYSDPALFAMAAKYIKQTWGTGGFEPRQLFVKWSMFVVQEYLGRLVMVYDDEVRLENSLKNRVGKGKGGD